MSRLLKGRRRDRPVRRIDPPAAPLKRVWKQRYLIHRKPSVRQAEAPLERLEERNVAGGGCNRQDGGQDGGAIVTGSPEWMDGCKM